MWRAFTSRAFILIGIIAVAVVWIVFGIQTRDAPAPSASIDAIKAHQIAAKDSSADSQVIVAVSEGGAVWRVNDKSARILARVRGRVIGIRMRSSEHSYRLALRRSGRRVVVSGPIYRREQPHRERKRETSSPGVRRPTLIE